MRTLHNKAFFWTVYSLGLRLQEGLNLQVGDIDGGRMVVHVHRGEGSKDRYVPLPPRTLAVLRRYWVTHRHPIWLFPATGRDHAEAHSATEPMAPPASTARSSEWCKSWDSTSGSRSTRSARLPHTTPPFGGWPISRGIPAVRVSVFAVGGLHGQPSRPPERPAATATHGR